MSTEHQLEAALEAANQVLREIAILCTNVDPADGEGTSPNQILEMVKARLPCAKQKNGGGPAFPISSSTGDPRDGVYCRDGMSKREWFAGKAMQGLLSNKRIVDDLSEQSMKSVVHYAYVIADFAVIEGSY